MSLEIKINDDIKAAMLARDKDKLEALRAVKAALLLIKTGKDTATAEVPEELELSTLQKLVKQRKEAADIYLSQNRKDLYDVEMFQVSIIQKYLPEQMSDDEIKVIINNIIAETGAQGMRDMGKVMGLASKQLQGKADNKIVSAFVKELLA
jgi:uncharacterized protein YqeY